MTLALGSIIDPSTTIIVVLMLTCCALPFNVGLEIGQFHQKTITKQHWKGERQVPEQCDPSWVSLNVA